MDKPKEFWIQNPYNEISTATKVSVFCPEVNPQITEEIHVIEYSAYEQLQKRFDEAVEVIKFYSNGGNLNRDIWFDEKLGYFTGKRAREFLRSMDKEN